MSAEWRTYRDRVYPQGTAAIQNKECHQAFFAGALVTMGKMTDIAALEEDAAVLALEKLHKEILEINQARANQVGPARN